MTLAASQQNSNWPHALDSIYDNGKRRRKQYFPEGLQGLFTLSKTEVADDIDLIEADADRTAFGHARRRACRTNASNKDDMDVDQDEANSSVNNQTANKATRRQRLLDKILEEHGIRDDARVQLSKVRRSLDDTRDQILSYRDGIARLQRQIEQCKVEEAQLKASFEARQEEQKRKALSLEQTRQNFMERMSESDEKLNAESDHVKALEKYESMLSAKNDRIQSLEIELETTKREVEILRDAQKSRQPSPKRESPPQMVGEDTEVEEASGSVAGPAIESFANRYTNELQSLSNRLRKATARISELDRQNAELERSLQESRAQWTAAQEQASESVAVQSRQESELNATREEIKKANAERDSVKKMAEKLTYDIEMGNEKMSAYMMVVEAADQRAQNAEDRLHKMIRSTSVLHGANVQLQNKLNKLIEIHQATLAEKEALEKDLGNIQVDPEVTTCQDLEEGDPDYVFKRTLQQDLKNVQLDMERLSDERDLDVMEDEEIPAQVTPVADDTLSNAVTDGAVSQETQPINDAKERIQKANGNFREASSRRRSSRTS